MQTVSDNRLKDYFKNISKRFDALLSERPRYKEKNKYYYSQVERYFKFIIPEGASVLEVGSGDGDLLASLKPSKGVGIDASEEFVRSASERHPEISFAQGYAEALSVEGKFDYIVLSGLVGFLYDVEAAFKALKPVCHSKTRIIVHYHSNMWEWALTLGDRLGLRMKQGLQNWLSLDDLSNLLHLSGFETVKQSRKILFPFYIPLISTFINRVLANLPFVNRLCLSEFIIARPKMRPENENPSVSVIVACKDEKGNIEELVERTPVFPNGSEIIFVDGHSTDGTQEEINRVKDLYPQKNIRLIDQGNTKGKGAAVRAAFNIAEKDILMILDADISVAPEDLLKFYEQIADGTGEFINGTRLVYPMEKHAMRTLNILGNKFFSLAFTYLLGQRLKDTLCGTKVIFRDDYKRLAANRTYFGDFDPFGDFDLLFGAAKMNLKILELPVRYYERRYGDIKIERFKHGLLLLRMCMVALRKLKFL